MTRILATAAVLGMLGASTAFADPLTPPISPAAATPNSNSAQETVAPAATNDFQKPTGGNDSRSLIPISPPPAKRLGNTVAEMRVFRIAMFVNELRSGIPVGSLILVAR
jgi:hypothetical protein